jgi:phospholipid/cholesterol/gamma-HCH transport system ATP-binding protein
MAPRHSNARLPLLREGATDSGTLAPMSVSPPPTESDPAPAGDEERSALLANRGEPVVSVRDLVARYDEQVILNGISVDVYPGEVMTIIGGSGSGKSTLLKCMLGIIKPVSGSVHVLGVDMINASMREREEIYRRMGMVYQSGALFGSMTVNENIALPLVEHTSLDPKIIDISVRMKLGLVRLSGFGDRLPSQLSGGQVKRVAFARAIAMDPELLFCDEPSAGLDPRIGRGIDDLIRSLNKAFNMAIVVVTHEMESVKIIADRIVMLAPMPGGARVVFSGTYEELECCSEGRVKEFVSRAPLHEPRAEAAEVLKQLVGED